MTATPLLLYFSFLLLPIARPVSRQSHSPDERLDAATSTDWCCAPTDRLTDEDATSTSDRSRSFNNYSTHSESPPL